MYYAYLRITAFLLIILNSLGSYYPDNFGKNFGASWESFDGKEYHLSTLNFTFRDAVTYCLLFNSLPVEVDTIAENKFLQTLMSQSPSCYWVGIEFFAGVFEWKITRSIPITSLWGSGEPNIKNPDEKICVRYKPIKGFHQLADWSCSERFNVVCERLIAQDIGLSSVPTEPVSPTIIPNMHSFPMTTIKTTSVNMTTTSTTTTSSLEKLLLETMVEDKSTNKYIRTKTCAEDKRTSSKVLGLVGGVVLAIVVLLPVATDACNLMVFSTKKLNKHLIHATNK